LLTVSDHFFPNRSLGSSFRDGRGAAFFTPQQSYLLCAANDSSLITTVFAVFFSSYTLEAQAAKPWISCSWTRPSPHHGRVIFLSTASDRTQLSSPTPRITLHHTLACHGSRSFHFQDMADRHCSLTSPKPSAHARHSTMKGIILRRVVAREWTDGHAQTEASN
jgi:hypothetical protein